MWPRADTDSEAEQAAAAAARAATAAAVELPDPAPGQAPAARVHALAATLRPYAICRRTPSLMPTPPSAPFFTLFNEVHNNLFKAAQCDRLAPHQAS